MTGSFDFASIPSLGAQRWPNRIALEYRSQSWTFEELDAAVATAAVRLRAAGVSAGERVALLLGNRPEYIIAQFALARIGAVFVTPNPHWTDHELSQALSSAGVSISVVDEKHEVFADRIGVRLDATKLLDAADTSEGVSDASFVTINDAEELFIPFSSGTTGLPKGVIHSRRSVTGGVRQLAVHLGLQSGDRLQISVPLCHIFGTTMTAAVLAVGATATLFERFDFDACLDHIRTGAVTVWPLAGSVAHRLLELDDLGPHMFPKLRYFMWGGSAVPAALAAAITLRTGIGFVCSYGMTEAMAVAFNPVDDPSDWRLDSPGYLSEGTEIRFAKDGELEVRGPSVADGYTTGPQDAFGPDGWFSTGDVARFDDDGRLWILDRRKDMIKVSGFQVAPAEVEGVLAEHPGVKDVAVIGIPDDRTGERVVACVALKYDWAEATEILPALREFATSRLAAYKLPRVALAVDEIPRTSAGKLQRARLRDAVIGSS